MLLFWIAWGAVLAKPIQDEEQGKLWLEDYNLRSQAVLSKSVFASWNYNTNITQYNQQMMMEASAERAQFAQASYEETLNFAWEGFSFPTRRQFAMIADVGTAVLSGEDFDRMSVLGAQMETTYSVAQVCGRPRYDPALCFPLDPDLTAIQASSRDWDELVWAWDGWRESSSTTMPPLFQEYVELQNKAANLNGYADGGEYWRSWYEDPDFEEDVAVIWEELKPFYQQLHAFVRRRLANFYKDNEDDFPESGHIPAHILGNMWAQQWNNIEAIVSPYPEKPLLDVTDEMIRQDYNVTYMFQLSEQFFTSLNLIPMPQDFWDNTMMVRPEGRDVVCHASAWDFYDGEHFRVKQCTEVDMSWLMVTHHEMGHVEYFLQYAHQPTVFRDGANPGFHEAIGDVMELSVSTPEHLEAIGLLPDFEDDPETDLNFLMSMALKKIAFIPFGYLIDQWRWAVFRGDVTPENYNSEWWKLRCGIQGVAPPTARYDGVHFDPGAKFHVPASVPYIRYFISHVLQFTFHKALCDAAGNTRSLHRCDVFGSQEAGEVFTDMMKSGSAEQWPDVLERMTGSRHVNAEALNEYFAPLREWLEKENEGETVGWDDSCPNNF